MFWRLLFYQGKLEGGSWQTMLRLGRQNEHVYRLLVERWLESSHSSSELKVKLLKLTSRQDIASPIIFPMHRLRGTNPLIKAPKPCRAIPRMHCSTSSPPNRAPHGQTRTQRNAPASLISPNSTKTGVCFSQCLMNWYSGGSAISQPFGTFRRWVYHGPRVLPGMDTMDVIWYSRYLLPMRGNEQIQVK
jgi:hypothetical protein